MIRNVGIDIGRYSVKIAVVHKVGKKSSKNIFIYNKLPEDLSNFKDNEKLGQYLVNLLKDQKLNKNIQPIVHLAASDVLMRNIVLPPEMKGQTSEIEGAIELELSNNLPFNIDEVYFDYQPAGGDENNFLAVAARKEIADQKTQLLNKIAKNNKACKVDVDAFAYERLLDAVIDKEFLNKSTIVIVDIGYAKTQIFFFEKGEYKYYRDRQISGKALTEAVAAAYDISLEEAENMKINNRPQDFDEIVIKPFINNMVEQIQFTIDFYTGNNPDSAPINKILLTGGGANIADLTTQIKERIHIETEPLMRTLGMTINKNNMQAGCDSLDFALAIALTV